jgi:signal transduction histidine kinase
MTARTPRAPWSPGTWRQALYLAGSIPALLLGVLIVLGCDPRGGLRLREYRFVWPAGSVTWWVLLPVGLAVVYLAMPLLTRMHRYRLRVTDGVDIPPQPARPNWLSPGGIVTAARSRVTWRQLGYHLLAGPALAVAAVAALSCWLAGIMYSLVYVYAATLPPWSTLHQDMSGRLNLHVAFLRAVTIPVDAYLTIGGFALLLAAPWLTAGVAHLDVQAARALLGPSRTEELTHRVEELAQTRAGAVDAADTERRRLERDLHDGTQQRLVSMAINLGMARAETTTVEEAHQAIAEAHEEAKAALTELRNLVRGLHPPVLEDRGLAAALSGLAARMPIPVRLTVDVPRRPPATIEAVAYFVVSEGLTNITKHAQASQAEVIVQRTVDRLHVIISDDGVGGADPAFGTGLAGLAKRAASVDGTFEIASPAGGPTLLTVDLPCAR